MAGVFDDVKLWWHLDFDSNSDGIAQLDEIRDQTDWGDLTTKGSSGHHAYNMSTPDSIDWTNGVPITSGGLPYGDMALEFQPQTNIVYTYTTNQVEVVTTNETNEVSTNMVDVVTTNSINQCWPETMKVLNASVAGDSTILCRFRWDGPAMETWNQPSWIVNNALNWSGWLGWMFGVRRYDNNYYLGMYIGQEPQYYYGVPLVRGKWYEAGAILRDNGTSDTVTFYLWPEDYWEDETQQNDKSGLTWQTYNSTRITNHVTSADIYVGGESQYWSLGTGDNASKSFRGALNYLAMWDRALSHNEMLEAFGYHTPLVTLGINNGDNQELIIESQGSSVYDVGDPWHTMPRAVTTGLPESTIRTELTDLQAEQNYVVHIDTVSTASSLPADIELIVNSTTNETISAVPGQQLFWDVPPEQLASGTNTFTIRYVGGEASWLSWDWLEIAGSWQVGYDNGDQWEFVREAYYSPDYFLSDPVWKHLRRAIVGHAPVDKLRLNFSLSQEIIDRYDFTYTAEIRAQGKGTGVTNEIPFPVTLKINDHIITNGLAVPDNTAVSFELPDSVLTNGNNSIEWIMEPEASIWSQFDYHKMEMALPPGPPKGTILILY